MRDAGQPAGVVRQGPGMAAMHEVGGPEEDVALFRQEAFIGHDLAPAGVIEFGAIQILVVVGEVHPFGAVLEQVVRQAVAAVVEGEFAAAFLHILQRDPGGGQQQRVFDGDDRGILMDAMAVAALEQKLLAGDGLGVEYQGQEAGDPRMEANVSRRGQVDVEVEQAFETIGRIAGKFQSAAVVAVVRGQEFAGC